MRPARQFSRHAPWAYASVLALLCNANLASAQEAPLTTHADKEPILAAEEATENAAARSVVIPASEIILFDLLLSNYNRRFSGSSDYDVSTATVRRNLHGPWVVDNDPFKINQFAHPYQGSLYHGAARSAGLTYWQSAALTFAGSAWWEITGEQTPPSRNDQIASGIAGSLLGEPLFRMAHLLLSHDGGVPHVWREWGAAAISPGVGLNRLMFGSRFDAAFADHDPAYHGRLRIGTNHATEQAVGTSTKFKPNELELDYSLDYGMPGKPDYTYRRPFDYFTFRAVVSSANGIQNLATGGLLYGTDYALGDMHRGIWGLYANYDYVAPQIFHISATSLSLGTTGQWWLPMDLALQATGLAGIGYAAASTAHGVADDRDYHYGTAPRLGLAWRLTASDRASADFSAQKYFLGRVANRSAGRDDIARIDTALTWRVTGRHAVGMKYVWSHRSASYPVIGDRRQTLATAGIFYTLLGEDGFGVVDWRTPAAH